MGDMPGDSGEGQRRVTRALGGLGRVLLVFLVVSGIAYLVLRPSASPEPTAGSAAATHLPSGGLTPPATLLPADLPTVVPTPDFVLPSVAPLTPVAGKRRYVDVVVATANLYVGLSQRSAIADVERLARDAQIIGLNEVSRPRAVQLRAWAATRPGWWFFSPTSPTNPYQGFNSVLVDTGAFTVLDQGVVYGSRSAMSDYRINSRWITWTLLEHRKSHARVAFVQTHMDAAVESGGHPRGRASQRVRSNVAYMQQLKLVVSKLASVSQVVVGGDWNVDAAADRHVRFGGFPFQVLESGGSEAALPGLRSIYTELGFKGTPTRSGRWVDYLSVWKQPAAEPGPSLRDYRVLTGVNSDHNPVQAIVRFSR